jgi:AcrR family transcriptional regulator
MKEDRRIQRTKQLLRDALVDLILEKGYENVYIRDITERANLSRATFYLHYKDKEELLTKSLYAVFDEVIAATSDATADTLITFDAKFRTLPFEHAYKYRNLYRVALTSTHSLPSVTNTARAYVSRHITNQLQRILPHPNGQVPLPIVANYLAGAQLSLISWWLEQDNPTYTPQYMAEMFYWLSLPTLSLLLGVNQPPVPEKD